MGWKELLGLGLSVSLSFYWSVAPLVYQSIYLCFLQLFFISVLQCLPVFQTSGAYFLAVRRIQIFKTCQCFQFQIGLKSKIFFQLSGQNHFQTSGHWKNLAFRRFPLEIQYENRTIYKKRKLSYRWLSPATSPCGGKRMKAKFFRWPDV